VSIHSSLDHRPLTTLDKSLITSITSFTALIASPLAGPLADSFGRKPVIFASDLLFVLGALLQALASSVITMAAGRAIVGLAIGAASALTPLYIAEAAPAKWRGRLVTISALFITGGQVVAYAVGWAFAHTEGGWRWMVGLGALPAILQAVGMIKMPESPRWLVREGKKDVAEAVLSRIHGGDERVVRNLVQRMEAEVKAEQEIDGWKSSTDASSLEKAKRTMGVLWNQPSNRKALTIACILQGGQQLCGFVSNLDAIFIR
jgi:SP family myo-inositol transporter-like MFS transporter 13